MREIKFRGKCSQSKRWVYGSLVRGVEFDDPNNVTWWIFEDTTAHQMHLVKYQHPIDPATIGQYTGLKDKNGKEIYEGDVLLWGDDNRQNQVVFSQGSFQMQRYGGLAPLRYHNLINSEAMNVEVIGNIYENPELLVDK